AQRMVAVGGGLGHEGGNGGRAWRRLERGERHALATATTATIRQLHDSVGSRHLPSYSAAGQRASRPGESNVGSGALATRHARQDRKSTRLNSSHSQISYAV